MQSAACCDMPDYGISAHKTALTLPHKCLDFNQTQTFYHHCFKLTMVRAGIEPALTIWFLGSLYFDFDINTGG